MDAQDRNRGVVAFLEASWENAFVAHVPSESRPGIIHVTHGVYCPKTEETFGGPYEVQNERWHLFCPCENFRYEGKGERGFGDVCKHLSAALATWSEDQLRRNAG